MGILDAAARWSKASKEDLNDKAFASAIYNTLAALYFLWSLCECHDFTANFAIPIDSYVAKFLQSDASVRSLIKVKDDPSRINPHVSSASSMMSGRGAGC